MEIQKNEFGEAIENTKDFDILKISLDDWYIALIESVKSALEILGGRDVTIFDIKIGKDAKQDSLTVLEDGKIYPKLDIKISVSLKSLPKAYCLQLTPFTAKITPVIPFGNCNLGCNNEKADIIITKSLKNFLTSLYGEVYNSKFKQYHSLIKNKKIAEIEKEKTESVEKVDEFYDQIL